MLPRIAVRGFGSVLPTLVNGAHVSLVNNNNNSSSSSSSSTHTPTKGFYSTDGTVYYPHPNDQRVPPMTTVRYAIPTIAYAIPSTGYPTTFEGPIYGYAYPYAVGEFDGYWYPTPTATVATMGTPTTQVREYTTYARVPKENIRQQVHKQIKQEIKEAAHTIHLTEEERETTLANLSFEQLERRILHQFELHQNNRARMSWLHELLHKSDTPERLQRSIEVMLIYQSRNVEFTESTAGAVINAGVRVQAPEKVLDLLLNSTHLLRLFPTAGSLNHLMIAFASRNPADLENLQRSFELIKRRNLLNAHTFEVLIRAYVNSQRVEDGLKSAYEAHKSNIALTRFTFSLLMKGCFDSGRERDVLQLESMMANHLPNSTELMYTVLAHLIVEGNVDGALQILSKEQPPTIEAALQKLISNIETSTTPSISQHLPSLAPLLIQLSQTLPEVSQEVKDKLKSFS